ncbi:MAG: thioesterase family protein [Acidimicrobiia bacterium]
MNDRPSLTAGNKFELHHKVTRDDCADRHGNPGVTVFATPVLCGLAERAAIGLLTPSLGPGEISVGTDLKVQHTAPTPADANVVITATVTEVDGGRLVFDIAASDDRGPIGTVLHERTIVKLGKFLQRAEARFHTQS